MPYTLTVITKSKETRVANMTFETVTDVHVYLQMVTEIWNTHWKGDKPPSVPGIDQLVKIGRVPSTIMKIHYPDGFSVEIRATMSV